MSKTPTSSQRWAEDSRIYSADAKPSSDELGTSESYRNPVRMFAVAMNMRRLAHARRASAIQGR